MLNKMDFYSYLSKIKLLDENGQPSKLVIHPWMEEARSHNKILASTPRRVGSTTYIALSALYDILFTDAKEVTIVTHLGGYQKKHMIDMLMTHYNWMMGDLMLDKQRVSTTSGRIKIGEKTIDVCGLEDAGMMFRGRTIYTIYADISCIGSENILNLVLPHSNHLSKCVLFLQGIQSNIEIKTLFDHAYNLSDMERVCEILKETPYWHAIKIKHQLTNVQIDEKIRIMGREMFSAEFET